VTFKFKRGRVKRKILFIERPTKLKNIITHNVFKIRWDQVYEEA